MDLYPVDWQARDVEGQYTVTVYGKTPEGLLVAAHIKFYPYFYVELPLGSGPGDVSLFISEACRKYKAVGQYSRAVDRVTLWGFTNDTKRTMAQLAFPSRPKMMWAARQYREQGVRTFESSMDPLLRFFHVCNIRPAHWITIRTWSVPKVKTTRAPTEVCTVFEHAMPSPRTDRPPLILASFDLEVYSESRKFPQADNDNDCIIQIAVAFLKYGDAEPYKTVVFALRETAPIAGVDIEWFDAEGDVIDAFIAEFDWKYLYVRAASMCVDSKGNSLVQLSELGRALEGGGMPLETRLNTSAYGNNSFFTLTTPGIMQLDLMQEIRKAHKLESWSLNFVASKFLGDSKMDLLPGEIFECFDGSASDRAIIAEYAAKDVWLPLRLLAKLCAFENIAQMANAVFCPVEYITRRGQQVRVYSVLMKQARAMGFVCPDGAGQGPTGKFAGATVLEAMCGAYFQPVFIFDFLSLYPSIIRAHGFDFTTYVIDARYDNLPGVTYHEVHTDQGTFRFAQGRKGVLPSLLETLAAFRKQEKEKMAEARLRGDEFAASVHDSLQLAYKITMNSAYGFCGATAGFLPCVAIAASVTATGRLMIARTKELVEELMPGSRVVYGDTDSVMVLMRHGADTDMAAQFKAAAWLAKSISSTFLSPIELEFEKVYDPYLLITKKRYAGLMFTRPDKPDGIDIKGLQPKRRDYPETVRDVCNAILDQVLYKRSPEGAVAEAVAHVLRILEGRVPIQKFVVSKALRGEYKNSQAQPHLQVALKMQQRTGESVPVGARVPYVIAFNPLVTDKKLAGRAEHPDHITSPDKIDILYYVEQLRIPIITLLRFVVCPPTAARVRVDATTDAVEDSAKDDDDPEMGAPVEAERRVFGHPDVARAMMMVERRRLEEIRTATNTSRNQGEITQYYKACTADQHREQRHGDREAPLTTKRPRKQEPITSFLERARH